MAAIAIGLELEQDRSLARAHPFERHLGRAAHRKHVHAVDLHAGNAKAFAAAIELVLGATAVDRGAHRRSEEHTSELQSLMRISYAVFCLTNKRQSTQPTPRTSHTKCTTS